MAISDLTYGSNDDKSILHTIGGQPVLWAVRNDCYEPGVGQPGLFMYSTVDTFHDARHIEATDDPAEVVTSWLASLTPARRAYLGAD